MLEKDSRRSALQGAKHKRVAHARRPDEESHEIALFANPAFVQVAFKVSSLAELRSLHDRSLLPHRRSELEAALRGTPRSVALGRGAA